MNEEKIASIMHELIESLMEFGLILTAPSKVKKS